MSLRLLQYRNKCTPSRASECRPSLASVGLIRLETAQIMEAKGDNTMARLLSREALMDDSRSRVRSGHRRDPRGNQVATVAEIQRFRATIVDNGDIIRGTAHSGKG